MDTGQGASNNFFAVIFRRRNLLSPFKGLFNQWLMIFYRILLFSAIATLLVILYFFVVGLGDGSVSSRNGTLWFALLAIASAVVGGGIWLNYLGYTGWSKAVLSILAIPGWLYALYILMVIFSKQRWN